MREFLIYAVATPPGLAIGLVLAHVLGVGPFHKPPPPPVRKATPKRRP